MPAKCPKLKTANFWCSKHFMLYSMSCCVCRAGVSRPLGSLCWMGSSRELLLVFPTPFAAECFWDLTKLESYLEQFAFTLYLSALYLKFMTNLMYCKNLIFAAYWFWPLRIWLPFDFTILLLDLCWWSLNFHVHLIFENFVDLQNLSK